MEFKYETWTCNVGVEFGWNLGMKLRQGIQVWKWGMEFRYGTLAWKLGIELGHGI